MRNIYGVDIEDLKTVGIEDKKSELTEIDCPFCGESNFDLQGLKEHLAYCEHYNNIPLWYSGFKCICRNCCSDVKDGKAFCTYKCFKEYRKKAEELHGR